MRTNKKQLTHKTELPLYGYVYDDKIYRHKKSGDKLNMGPFLEMLGVNWLNKSEVDLEFDKAIKHCNDTMSELMTHEQYDGLFGSSYSDILYLLYRLKETIKVMRNWEGKTVNP